MVSVYNGIYPSWKLYAFFGHVAFKTEELNKQLEKMMRLWSKFSVLKWTKHMNSHLFHIKHIITT